MPEGTPNGNQGQAGQAGGTGQAPAAGNQVATPSGAAAGGSPTPGDWMAGFSDDQKGYVANKGFKGPLDVLDSYRNFEKLQGVPQDRILKLPENMDTPEARAVWERLGTPKDVKGYNLEVPKEGGDPKMAEWAAAKFLELGIPKTMAEKLNQAWNERAAQAMTAHQENMMAMVKNADAALRKEWGMAYDQNRIVADAGAKNAGMSPDEAKALGMALGPDKAMRLLHKIGAATGESSFINGRPAADGTLAPNQARTKQTELMKDQNFYSRLMNNDASAKAEWQRLGEMAAGNENIPL